MVHLFPERPLASLMLMMVAIVLTLGNFCLLSHLFQHVPYILGLFKGQWEQGPHGGASYLHSFPGSVLPPSRLHLSKVILTLSSGRQHHTSMLGGRGEKAVDGACSSEIIAMKLTSDEECDGLKWS